MKKFGLLVFTMLFVGVSYCITIDNFKDNETIRYSVPLLRGTIQDKDLKEIKVVNKTSKRETAKIDGVAYKGKYKGMTELVPGKNEIVIIAGKEKLNLTINYLPQTNPIKVKAVYFTDSEGNTKYQSQFKDDKFDYKGKFDTALKLSQSFVADWMNEHGYGRRTFALELEDNGKVKVNLIKGKLPTEEYETLGRYPIARTLYKETLEQLKDKDCIYYAVTPMSRHLPNGSSTCYGMVNIGFFSLIGGSIFYTWPDSLNEVTERFSQDEKINKKLYHADDGHGGTIWGTAAHTIGAGLHELIHGFYVPHCANKDGVMAFGYNQFNRYFTFYEPPANRAGRQGTWFEDNGHLQISKVSAAALAPTKFFAMDQLSGQNTDTKIEVDFENGDLVIKNKNGIRFIAIEDWSGATGPWAKWFIEYPKNEKAPVEYRIKASDIKERSNGSIKNIGIRVIDDQGVYYLNHNIESLVSEPSLTKWRYFPKNTCLTVKDELPEVNAENLKNIYKLAMKEPIIESERSIMILPPRKYSENFKSTNPQQLGHSVYGVREIKVKDAVKLTAVFKGVPLLRIWLNGKLILTSKDKKIHEIVIDLKKGKNVLIFESSRFGGWLTFSMQLKDENNNYFLINDDGTLKKTKSISKYLSKF